MNFDMVMDMDINFIPEPSYRVGIASLSGFEMTYMEDKLLKRTITNRGINICPLPRKPSNNNNSNNNKQEHARVDVNTEHSKMKKEDGNKTESNEKEENGKKVANKPIKQSNAKKGKKKCRKTVF